MSRPAYGAGAMKWLIDFQDCLEGDDGDEWAIAAEDFVQRSDLPTDGTSWGLWRDLRWTS